jgi:hypothetical protein
MLMICFDLKTAKNTVLSPQNITAAKKYGHYQGFSRGHPP